MFSVLLQPSEKPQTHKFSKEDIVNFHGQELAKSDYEALEQIAKQYFNKSAEEYFQNSERKEVHIENKRVVKLKILNENLEKIPEQIQKLTQLQCLDLGHSHISKIENLEQLTELQELHLWDNKISKIENLEHQTKLQKLVLGMNYNISKIENLEQQKQLKELYLMVNKISKIENLEQLTQLQNLSLENNKITKIENLEQQKQLKELNITGNPVREEEPEIAELVSRGMKLFVEKRPNLMESLDININKEFHLEDLKDSYDPKELVPDSVAQKVAKAYNYVRCDKKLGEQYLEQSILGRKISGIIAHDKKTIENFSHPFYDLCQTVKKEGSKDVSKELNARVNKRKDKKKLNQQAEDCLKRIELYRSVNAFPEQLDYPEDWKK